MPEMRKGDLNVFKSYKNLVYSIYNIDFSTGHNNDSFDYRW